LRRRGTLPEIPIDRSSAQPLHRQVAGGLRAAIRSGELAGGAVLPSTRALAAALGVSRNTIVTAYEELAADGLLLARAGSSTRVLAASPVPRLPDWRRMLRESQFPAEMVRFRDHEGNTLYFHR
jgi:DNA-binding FadR family transcriptional regulator